MGVKHVILLLLLFLPFAVVLYRILFMNKENVVTDSFTESRFINYRGSDLKSKIVQSMRESCFQFVKTNDNGRNFRAMALPSLSSWSEVVSVVINQNTNGVEIIFKSRCAFPIQVYAWGKNKRNAEKFFRNLNKYI